MTVATYVDVETVTGRPIPDGPERQQVDWWLTGVEMYIKARLGDVAALDQEAVRHVEAEAVAAKVRRAGVTESSITVAVDDGSVTRRWDTPVTAADITDEWWELLSPTRQSAAFSTRPGHTPDALCPRPRNWVWP